MSLVDGLEELKDVRELARALKGTGKQNPAVSPELLVHRQRNADLGCWHIPNAPDDVRV